MAEMSRHIGPDVDIPAGDIGVGTREISYLFGQYLKLSGQWNGVLTGKNCSFGGSVGREEATGYGAVYFCREMLQEAGEDISGKRVSLSGSGNVALFAAEKALALGATVVSLSDSQGTAHFPKGLTADQLAAVKELKFQKRGRLRDLEEPGVDYRDGKKPWGIEADIAMPCATQNEITLEDAKKVQQAGIRFVCEGANMPVDLSATGFLRHQKIVHAPGKASNAGGVAVSGFELSQNAMRISWSKAEVDAKLQSLMSTIHQQCLEHGKDQGSVSYIDGANRASFLRVAEALVTQGVV